MPTKNQSQSISPVRIRRSGLNTELTEDNTPTNTSPSMLGEGVHTETFTTSKHSVECYYPVQFEALRAYNGVSLRDYLSSLTASENWDDNTGGKTGARFFKTFDQRFVFKEVGKREFTMLIDFLPKYFKYTWEAYNSGTPSLLIKLFGVYEIVTEKKTRYLFAMENLFFGITPDLKVYDLKGSQLNRYVMTKEGERRTLLDTNYILDRNGEPLPIKDDFYNFIDEAVHRDSQFLASQKKMDYSLLVMYNEDKSIMRVGIIDYLRDFDLEKHIEYHGKRIIKGSIPTTTPPEDYKTRFRQAMKRYFIPIQDQQLKN